MSPKAHAANRDLLSTMWKRFPLQLTFLLTSSLLPLCNCSNNEPCPTWFYRTEEGRCTCGSNLVNVIICNNETGEVGILSSFCLTSFDSGKDPIQAVVGSCLYGQNHGTATGGGAGLYVKVAPNITEHHRARRASLRLPQPPGENVWSVQASTLRVCLLLRPQVLQMPHRVG